MADDPNKPQSRYARDFEAQEARDAAKRAGAPADSAQAKVSKPGPTIDGSAEEIKKPKAKGASKPRGASRPRGPASAAGFSAEDIAAIAKAAAEKGASQATEGMAEAMAKAFEKGEEAGLKAAGNAKGGWRVKSAAGLITIGALAAAAGYYYLKDTKFGKAIGLATDVTTKVGDKFIEESKDLSALLDPNKPTHEKHRLAEQQAAKKGIAAGAPVGRTADPATATGVPSGGAGVGDLPNAREERKTLGRLPDSNNVSVDGLAATAKTHVGFFPTSAEEFAANKEIQAMSNEEGGKATPFVKDGVVDYGAIQKKAYNKINAAGLGNYNNAGMSYMLALTALKVINPPSVKDGYLDAGRNDVLDMIKDNSSAFVRAFNQSYGPGKKLGDSAAEAQALKAGLDAMFANSKTNDYAEKAKKFLPPEPKDKPPGTAPKAAPG